MATAPALSPAVSRARLACGVQFTLTYDGPLKPSGRAPDVQHIREHLDPQLRDLWSYEPLSHALGPEGFMGTIHQDVTVGAQHFRPLVQDALKLTAHLEVLMLKPGQPGGVVRERGDIDNRLKTLFDALSAPATAQQVQFSELGSSKDAPMYVVLEDDRLITGVRVTTDRLLGASRREDVRLVITVTLKATSLIYANMPLVSY
jgi:hypothetical protein